ncbi:hypothetical protein BCR34DRAFT_556815 [Clohesyomyces aquaticus]|uniref:Uncharacterized protein n=1 Tax=Clohesyomyces aquaticus TaxID=1231657 RepID=A0A1Y2A214_9PLEO|nr:hypothetical protein BCR34DRAFT_556815 [Clohesyomyces aquaticus]
MERLPLELLEICVEASLYVGFEIRPLPDTSATATGPERLQTKKWATYARSSYVDLCNIRRTNRRLHAASHRAFGRMLSDRIFRLTKFGLDDLEQIGSDDALRMHVRTITFGTSTFTPYLFTKDRLSNGGAWKERLQEALFGASTSWYRRFQLKRTLSQCYDWQSKTTKTDLNQRLAILLGNFPNLDSVRIRYEDGMDWNDDHRLLVKFPNEYRAFQVALAEKRRHDRFDPSPHVHTKPSIVAAALRDANVCVKDLRLDNFFMNDGYSLPHIVDQHPPFTNLRVLRISIYIDLTRTQRDRLGDTQALLKLIRSAPLLEDVGLTMSFAIGDYDGIRAKSSSILSALSTRPLMRLALDGQWHFTEVDLLNLWQTQYQTLESVVFDRIFLCEGSFTSALNTVKAQPFDKLRYLEIKRAVTYGPGMRIYMNLGTDLSVDFTGLPYRVVLDALPVS